MPGIETQAQQLVATAAEVARLRKIEPIATILARSTASLLMTGSDSWEGVDLFTLALEVPVADYAAIDNLEQIESTICDMVGRVARKYPGSRITQALVAPRIEEHPRVAAPASSAKPPQAEPAEEPPSFWTPGCFRLFISHIATMKANAHFLKSSLAKYHIAAFVAHDDIEPTKQWEAEIERALRTMDALAAIISPGFAESLWCDQEVGFAIGRGKLIVPLCTGVTPHGFMGKYQAAQIKGQTPPQVAESLFGILISNSQSSERMTDALVDRMAKSSSFDMSREAMALLQNVRHLNTSQITKLVQSVEDNSQVKNAIRIPERIRALASKLSNGEGT